jgi:hypothetical protein
VTGKLIDLASAREAIASARASVAAAGPGASDSGLRVVVVSDAEVNDEELGWHCYGPFDRASAVMVADDMRTTLDEAGMTEIQVRLIGWEPWPAEEDDE